VRIGIETSATSFNNAGTARYCQALVDSLRALASNDIDLVELRATRRLRLPRPGLARKIFVAYWELIYCTRILPAQLRRHRIDLLHCTIPLPLHSGLLDTGTKIVTTICDVIPFSHPEWFPRMMGLRLRRRMRRAVEGSQHLIAISNFTKWTLSRYLNVPADHISVTHLGVNHPTTVAHCDLGEALLAVGTLEPRKNLVVVLEAYRLLRQRVPVPPKLLIVGGQGWGDHALNSLIRKGELKGGVQLLGFVPDDQLFALYRSARMLLYPSLQEGFGLPVLEAMACGCPVITANTSSLPEVAGDAAILADPSDAPGLADAIHKLLTDDALARELSQKGLRRAAQFSWERCARQTVDVYRALLEGGRPG
jgi:O-antigen biosynthesis alpha-1,3-mannosyltransferase